MKKNLLLMLFLTLTLSGSRLYAKGLELSSAKGPITLAIDAIPGILGKTLRINKSKNPDSSGNGYVYNKDREAIAIGGATLPTISYTTPNYYSLNTPMTQLSPTSSGVSSINYPGTPNALSTTGLNGCWGIGVDASGSLYVCNAKSGGNTVYKYTSAGKSPASFITGVTGPTGIVFDSSGNAFVSTNTGVIYKYPYTGGSTPTSTFYTGGTLISGLTIDAANNIYFADFTLKKVYKYNSSGQLQFTISSSATLIDPSAVQVDAAGYIYVLDAGGNQSSAPYTNSSVQKYDASGNYLSTIVSAAASTVASTPAYGFYLDKSGNFWVGNNGSNTITMYSQNGAVLATLSSSGNITNPRGIYVDGTGTVYTTNYSTNEFYQLVPTGGYFIASGGALPAGLSLLSTSGVISGTPTVAGSGTYTVICYNSAGGTTSSGFVLSCGAAAVTVSYTPASYYLATGTAISSITPTVTGSPTAYAISPVLPTGLSMSTSTGVITGTPGVASATATYTISTTGGNNTSSTTISITTGAPPTISYATPNYYVVGSAITTLSPTSSMMATGGYSSAGALPGPLSSSPYGMGTDASGNIYVTNNTGNNVTEYASSGAYIGVFIASVNNPSAIVFDNSGNAYVGTKTGSVFKYNSSGTLQGTVTSTPASVYGLGIDASNNLYIADFTGAAVYKYTNATPGTLSLTIPTSTNLTTPSGVEVDPAGNIYVLDSGGGRIVKYSSAGTFLSNVVATGIGNPSYGFNMDKSGNMYVGDSGNNHVAVYSITGLLLNTFTTSTLTSARGIAIDPAGDVFISVYTKNLLYRYTPLGDYYISNNGPLPAGLTFIGSTGAISGTPTAASPSTTYTITGYNNSASTTTTENITVFATVGITTSGTLAALTGNYGTASASTNFTLSGNTIAAGVLITAPTGFEVSLDNNTFASSVTYGAAGNSQPTTVYVRLAAASTPGTYSGNVVLSSSGLTSQNVATASSTVNQAPLTITGISVSDKVYGAGPAATINGTPVLSGIVGTDDVGLNSSAAAAVFTSVAAGSNVAVTVSGYTLTGTTASYYTLTQPTLRANITQAPLTITADNQTKAYGAALPTLTASYNGFVNNDNSASLTTAPAINTTATASSTIDGGPYAITPGGAVDDNYIINYVQGSLTVTPAALTITADNQAKAYGAALPTLTASYNGFVNNDNAASLTTAPAINTTATASSTIDGGPYPITPGGAVDDNYIISYVQGSLTVTPVALTITADNQTKAYGAALPTLTASYNGFVNNDNAASLTTAPAINTTATASSTIDGGPYPITPGGAVDDNYIISYVQGSLTVTPVALTITADNQTKAYGAALPTLTASYNGFVNNDNSASLTTAPAINTTATASSTIDGGPYPITPGGAVDDNYIINYVQGLLTVTPVALTITANDQTSTYGAAFPTFTASYAGFVNNDNSASLTTAPTLSTTAVPTSAPGPYAINASGAVDDNYSIAYVSGTLTITASADATLSAITLSTGTLSPAFSPGTTSGYTASVPSGTGSITVTPTTTSTGATVKVNGYAASTPVTLVTGPNTVTVLVTAQDGVTQQTYTVTVTEAEPSTLSNFSFSAGTHPPVFVPGKTSYLDTLNTSLTAVAITPYTTSANATVTVNGTSVTSGSESQPIALNEGQTSTATIVVTAGDNSSQTTYTVSIFRLPSGNAHLSYLSISNHVPLSPVFAISTTSYTATVTNGTPSVTITPTVADANATVTVNGTPVTSATPSQNITLVEGSNTINTVVTAQDGTVLTYILVINHVPSAVATLANLALSHGGLSPGFSSSTTSYTTVVGNTITSITETPTTTDPTATVVVNGVAVTSGAATNPIALNIGSNTITTVVTAGDGSTTDTYTATVTRLPSSNAKLAFLGLSQAVLSPAFGTATTSYTASVPNTLSSTNVLPIEADTTARTQVNGVAVTSGTSTPVALNVGANTITAVVTAQDGVTQVTYTVTVTRAPSSVATLSSLAISQGGLSPGFGPSKTSYTAQVGETVTSITETPATTDPTATVMVNGTAVTSGMATNPIMLNIGSNTITTVVTAGDGSTTDTYTVTVTRLPSSNAKLGYLGLSKVVLSPAFATATTSYTASVANNISSTNVLPIEVGPGATIAVNGVAVASGASTPVSLNVGATIINTVVTAQDGVTQVTYTVTVNRAAPSSAYVIYDPISVEKPSDSPQLVDNGIVVHQGVSPNGDGIDDFLQIDGITQYPENKLTIINRSGILIYETKGYDNNSRTFDGHSNKNGQMQLPGTYFFSLDYTANGIIKHKTGYIVLKY